MTATAFRVMLSTLLRDRGALAMAFAIPPLLYLILSAAFSDIGGGLIPSDKVVRYYAGAIAAMFLLFAAAEGAIVVTEESASGLLERCLLGSVERAKILVGKFLFLLALGCLQAALVFAVAWAVHGVSLADALLPWAGTTLAAAAAAAGAAIAVAAACTSRSQAQAITNAGILVVTALGGSMVPRFLMPRWLQDFGGFVPTAWVIDAYQSVLTGGGITRDLVWYWAALGAVAVGAIGAATLLLGWQANRHT